MSQEENRGVSFLLGSCACIRSPEVRTGCIGELLFLPTYINHHYNLDFSSFLCVVLRCFFSAEGY